MKPAKIFLVILSLLTYPFYGLAKEPHISDVLDGKVKESPDAISKSKIDTFKGSSKKHRAIYDERHKEAQLKIERSRKQYPEVDKLYNSTYEAAQISKEKGEEQNGTDLALKRLAAEFEKQFLTLMWQYASNGVGSGENFANDMWNSRWRESIIDAGTEMGDIGMAVYEELRRIDSKKPVKRRR